MHNQSLCFSKKSLSLMESREKKEYIYSYILFYPIPKMRSENQWKN